MTEHQRARDDANNPFRVLNREQWQRPDHQAELRERLLQVRQAESVIGLADRRRRRFLAAGFLLGGLLAATTITACGGWEWLRELFSVRVFDIERGEDGEIEGLTLEDHDGRLLQLRPIGEPVDGLPPEVPMPVDVEIRLLGGGELAIRVHRDGGLGLVPSFKSVDPKTPQQGAVIELRPIGNQEFRAELHVDAVVFQYVTEQGAPGRTVLPAVPGEPRRYADDKTIIEILR